MGRSPKYAISTHGRSGPRLARNWAANRPQSAARGALCAQWLQSCARARRPNKPYTPKLRRIDYAGGRVWRTPRRNKNAARRRRCAVPAGSPNQVEPVRRGSSAKTTSSLR